MKTDVGDVMLSARMRAAADFDAGVFGGDQMFRIFFGEAFADRSGQRARRGDGQVARRCAGTRDDVARGVAPEDGETSCGEIFVDGGQ